MQNSTLQFLSDNWGFIISLAGFCVTWGRYETKVIRLQKDIIELETESKMDRRSLHNMEGDIKSILTTLRFIEKNIK